MTTRRITASSALVAALTVAAGIHLGVAIQHRGVGLHGLFFAAAGAAQLLLAVGVRRRPSHGVLAATALVSVALVATWALTRMPALTNAPELTGAVDLTATGLALCAAALAVLHLRRDGARPHDALRPIPTLVLLAAVGLTTVTTAVGPSNHSEHHHHDQGHEHTTDPHDPDPIFGDLFEDHHGHAPEADQDSH